MSLAEFNKNLFSFEGDESLSNIQTGKFWVLRNFSKNRRYYFLLSGLVGEKFPGQTGSLEFFTALPDKIFCLGLSSHSQPSGKFVYARYARYTNSNTLLWLRLSSINVFGTHFVRAKNRPSSLEHLSSPRQILFLTKSINFEVNL